jgi:hypothetical protein
MDEFLLDLNSFVGHFDKDMLVINEIFDYLGVKPIEEICKPLDNIRR